MAAVAWDRVGETQRRILFQFFNIFFGIIPRSGPWAIARTLWGCWWRVYEDPEMVKIGRNENWSPVDGTTAPPPPSLIVFEDGHLVMVDSDVSCSFDCGKESGMRWREKRRRELVRCTFSTTINGCELRWESSLTGSSSVRKASRPFTWDSSTRSTKFGIYTYLFWFRIEGGLGPGMFPVGAACEWETSAKRRRNILMERGIWREKIIDEPLWIHERIKVTMNGWYVLKCRKKKKRNGPICRRDLWSLMTRITQRVQ